MKGERGPERGAATTQPGSSADTESLIPAQPAADPAAGLRPEDTAERLQALDSMLEPISILRAVRDDLGAICDFTWTYLNQAAADVLGAAAADLLGARLLERLPGHRAGLFGVYVRVVETGQPFQADEYVYDDTWGTGETVRTIFRIRAVRSGDGFAVSWSDVTDSVRSRQELAHSERIYRNIMTDSALAMALVAPSGQILDVNPALCRFVGRDRDMIVGMTVGDISHPDDLKPDRDNAARILSGEIDTYRMTHRYLHADGRVVVGDVTVTLVRDDAGAPEFFLAQANDITDRVAALHEVSEDALLFRSAMHASNVGMSLIAVDGTFLDVNEALSRFLGYDRRTLLKLTRQQVTHPDDLEADLEQTHRVFTGEIDSYRMTKRYRHADASTVVGDFSLSAVRDEDGAVSHFVSQVIDVTARSRVADALAKSEATLRLLSENAMDIVVMFGADGRVEWASPSVRDLLGAGPEDLIGTTVHLLHPHDRQRVEIAIRAALAEHRDSVRERGRAVAADGQGRWFDVAIRFVWQLDGSVRNAIVSLHDVTEAVQATEALARSEARYRSLADRMSDVVLLADAEGRIEWISGSVRRTLGWEADDLVGRHVTLLLHPDDIEKMPLVQGDLVAGRPVHVEARLRSADAEYHWFEVTVSPVDGPQGPASLRVATWRPIDAEVAARRQPGERET